MTINHPTGVIRSTSLAISHVCGAVVEASSVIANSMSLANSVVKAELVETNLLFDEKVNLNVAISHQANVQECIRVFSCTVEEAEAILKG